MINVSENALKNQYDEITERCLATCEPICTAKNGEPDLVVMSHVAYEKHLALLKLKERLIDIEFEQINGAKFYNIDELGESLKNIINN